MIVADASTVIEILLRASLSTPCEERLFGGSELICVPHLIDLEIAQVLRRYVLRHDIDEKRGAQAIDDLIDLPILRYPHEPLLPRIWDLRQNLSAYDAAYVALAEALQVPLITCDAGIASSPGHTVVVELIS